MTGQFHLTYCGPQVSIQDGGRPGLLRYGIPASGPLAPFEFHALGAALDQRKDFVAIEVSLGGLDGHWLGSPIIAGVFGGDFQVQVNGRDESSWSVFVLRDGDHLRIRGGVSGNWCYFGFAGLINSQTWQGSRAMHVPSAINGAALRSGDRIGVEAGTARDMLQGQFPRPPETVFAGACDVVLGPQEHFFSKEALDQFLKSDFALTDQSDRMGRRLNGPYTPINADLTMPSEALLPGAVQIAGDLQPTVLLADHQTTGGYPKIAALTTASRGRFVQGRTDDLVGFTVVSVATAQNSLQMHRAALARYIDDIPNHRGSFADRLTRANLISGVVRAER